MKLRVLVLVRDFSWQGGVVNFISMMLAVFSSDIAADIFTVGRRPGRDTLFQRTIQTIVDCGKLFTKIRNQSYDIVHLNPSLTKASILRDGCFMFILRLLRTPRVLVFFRGWEEPFYQKILANRLYLFFFKALFLKADKIVVLGKTFQEKLYALGVEKHKVVILSTMFNGQSFKNLEKVREDGEFHFVFLSRYIAEKGLLELLEAFRCLTKKKSFVKLLLAGDGPLRQEMTSWIKKNEMSEQVVLLDYLRDEAKAQFLINGDCFILPSYYGEGCPNALLEAMAAGLAIITTPVGGIPDIIQESVNGILLDDISPITIARAMEEMIENEEWCKSVRETNKRQAWKSFESHIVISKIEKIYYELIPSNC